MKAALVSRLRRRLPRVFLKKLPRTVRVISVSERQSKRLNIIYLNKKKPANVLSFYYSPLYGEIVVSPVVIRREARAAGHSYVYQMTWMIAHGMLHLAGMRHEGSKVAAKRFERVEQSILKRIKK